MSERIITITAADANKILNLLYLMENGILNGSMDLSDVTDMLKAIKDVKDRLN